MAAPCSLLPALLLCLLAGCERGPGGGGGASGSSGTGGADGGAGGAPCVFVGTMGAPAEIEPLLMEADGSLVPLHDGDPIDILTPPQGGIVAFVGVRARNLSLCGARVSGAIRDLGPDRLVRVDLRSVTLREDGTGWAAPLRQDFSSVANIPLCHNVWSSRDLYGVRYQLEVELFDAGRKSLAKQTLSVTPRCADAAARDLAECMCICKQGYRLGDGCMGGAGMGGGGG